MIDPEAIRRKALRLLPEVLREALEEALPSAWAASAGARRPLFPLDIPGDRGRSTDPFAARKAGIEALIASSKDRTGVGYALAFRRVSTRLEGKQTLVDRVYFETRSDFATFLRERLDLPGFVREATHVVGKLPGLAPWIHDEPLTFLEHGGEWVDLSAVCEHFVRYPRPGCYARQLPVPVHTKFIEEHHRILSKLLDQVLPANAVRPAAETFEERYGLRSPEALIRIRFLDPPTAPYPVEDLALPGSELGRVAVRCRTVFIVENLLPFLAFPAVRGAVCLWGSGFRAAVVGAIPWIAGCRTLYWGDLDLPGFDILASLRVALPRVESMLMDEAAYRRYRAFAVEGPKSAPGWMARPSLLSESERAAVAALNEDPRRSRLEQERITQADLVSYLARAGFTVLGGAGV